MFSENLEKVQILDFEDLWKPAKYPPKEPGYYMTIRCGLGGIYTHLDEFKNGQWQLGITDDSGVIAYQKNQIPPEKVNEWCRSKLQKLKEKSDLDSEIDRYIGYPEGDPDEDPGTSRLRKAAKHFAEWGQKHTDPKPKKYDYTYFSEACDVSEWLKKHPEKTLVAITNSTGTYTYTVFYSEPL